MFLGILVDFLCYLVILINENVFFLGKKKKKILIIVTHKNMGENDGQTLTFSIGYGINNLTSI